MTAIRRTITSCGGEVRFGSRVTELLLHGDAVAGVVCGGERIEARSVVLATGHSADDVYAMLHRQGCCCRPSRSPWASGWSIRKLSSTRYNITVPDANTCPRPPIP